MLGVRSRDFALDKLFELLEKTSEHAQVVLVQMSERVRLSSDEEAILKKCSISQCPAVWRTAQAMLVRLIQEEQVVAFLKDNNVSSF